METIRQQVLFNYDEPQATTKLVSVIIAIYNRAELVKETFHSLIAQTYKNWEAMVVDDGSTDHTLSVLQEYSLKDSRIQWFRRPPEKHKGPASCRNYGIIHSKGEYLVFFDSDDLMHENYLSDLVETLDRNPLINIAACRPQRFYVENGKKIFMDAVDFENIRFPQDFFSRKLKIGTPALMFRRSALDMNDLWNEKIVKSEDYEFYSRLLVDNTGALVDRVLIFVRTHGTGMLVDYFSGKKPEVESDFLVRRKVYRMLESRGMITREFIDFVLITQLNNIKLCLKKHYFGLAVKIFIFILFLRHAPGKGKKMTQLLFKGISKTLNKN